MNEQGSQMCDVHQSINSFYEFAAKMGELARKQQEAARRKELEDKIDDDTLVDAIYM